MKNTLLILLLAFFCGCIQGQQVVSVKSGDFFSDSVWAGGIRPNLSHDSISIQTYLNFYQDFALRGTSYLYISPSGTLCGAHNVTFTDSSSVWVRGNLYVDSMLTEVAFIDNGYVDALFIDIEGQYTANPPPSYYKDSCGGTYVHDPPQLCAPDTSRMVYTDTNIYIRVYNKSISLDVGSSNCYVSIKFGDGDSTTTDSSTSIYHTYSEYGSYMVSVNSLCVACGDTFAVIQTKTVHIDSICNELTNFAVYPNPCADYFYIKYTSCTIAKYTLPVYDMLGQIIKYVTVDNSGTPVKVNSDDLASGIYMIRMPNSVSDSEIPKIVVFH